MSSRAKIGKEAKGEVAKCGELLILRATPLPLYHQELPQSQCTYL